jgi:hypothetical protein
VPLILLWDAVGSAGLAGGCRAHGMPQRCRQWRRRLLRVRGGQPTRMHRGSRGPGTPPTRAKASPSGRR